MGDPVERRLRVVRPEDPVELPIVPDRSVMHRLSSGIEQRLQLRAEVESEVSWHVFSLTFAMATIGTLAMGWVGGPVVALCFSVYAGITLLRLARK